MTKAQPTTTKQVTGQVTNKPPRKNLGVNESNTEEYEVKWKGDDEWKMEPLKTSSIENH